MLWHRKRDQSKYRFLSIQFLSFQRLHLHENSTHAFTSRLEKFVHRIALKYFPGTNTLLTCPCGYWRIKRGFITLMPGCRRTPWWPRVAGKGRGSLRPRRKKPWSTRPLYHIADLMLNRDYCIRFVCISMDVKIICVKIEVLIDFIIKTPLWLIVSSFYWAQYVSYCWFDV